jgi:hypothetical protein
LGDKMLRRAKQKRVVPLPNEFPEAERICPASGAAYDMFYLGDEVVLYCPDHDYQGRYSVRWVAKHKWVDRFAPKTAEEFLAQAVVLGSRFQPKQALDLSLRSYNLKKSGYPLLMALIAAVDLDDRISVEHIANYAQSLPFDVVAQIDLAHSLGYLGRYAEAERMCKKLDKVKLINVTGRVRGLIALAKGDDKKALEQFQRTGRDFGWASAWVHLARRDFTACTAVAQAALNKEGYSDKSAIDWVRLVTLCGMALGGEEENRARAVLAVGLRKCRRVWPYPILLYLNREISEEELRRRTPAFPEEQVRVDITMGLEKSIRGRGDRGLSEFARVRQSWSLETYVARLWSK